MAGVVEYKVMEGRSFSKTIRRYRGELLLCVLAAVLLVPNVMNAFAFGAENVEGFSVKLANMPVPEMLGVTAADVHPPLYYLILRIAVLVCGNHVFVYRFVSLIPYLILVIFALTVLRRTFGPWCAAVFLTFASMTTTALRYNTHIRMYSWCALFLTLAFYILYRIMRDGRRKDYVLLAVFTLCAGYLQYYALVTAALLYLFLLVLLLVKKDGAALRNWLLSAGIALAGYLPWLTVFLRSFQRTAGEHWMPQTESFLTSYKSIFSARFSLVWPTLWLLLTAYAVYAGRRSGKGTEKDNWLLAGVVCVIGTVLAGLLISALTRPMYNTRYLYPASPVAWMSLGVCAERIPWKKYIVPAILAVFLVFQTLSYLRTLQTRLPVDAQMRQAVETVQKKGTDGAVLVSEEPIGGYDDKVILDMGYATGPMTDFYFRGIAEEVRIDPADPTGWALPQTGQCFLFAEEALQGDAVRLLEERGFSVECISEGGFRAYSIYYLLPQEE